VVADTDSEVAEREAWQDLADSCVEHDAGHEARALAELVRLGLLPPLPEPRRGRDG